jgi:hypothetical protein
MDEDVFNMEVRKFLKKVGVASQREIENVVREAVKTGRLAGKERLRARMKLEVDDVQLTQRMSRSQRVVSFALLACCIDQHGQE